MTLSSPALSNAATSETSTSNSNSKSTATATATAKSALNNFNYAELFEDVNWEEVNLIDIEREWRNELDQIEKVLEQEVFIFLTLLYHCYTFTFTFAFAF